MAELVALGHFLVGDRVRYLRHPDSGDVLAFREADLAATVAAILAGNGWRAAGLVAAPERGDLHVVEGESEALDLTIRLVELVRSREATAARAAVRN